MSTTHTRNEIYWLERGGVAIGTNSETTGSVTGPTGDLTVTIYAIKNGDTFVTDESGGNGQIGYLEEPDIPEEFRHAVVAKAIQRGYELNPDTLTTASYWERQYNLGVIEGKRYANTGRVQKTVIKLQGFEPTVHSTRDRDEE